MQCIVGRCALNRVHDVTISQGGRLSFENWMNCCFYNHIVMRAASTIRSPTFTPACKIYFKTLVRQLDAKARFGSGWQLPHGWARCTGGEASLPRICADSINHSGGHTFLFRRRFVMDHQRRFRLGLTSAGSDAGRCTKCACDSGSPTVPQQLIGRTPQGTGGAARLAALVRRGIAAPQLPLRMAHPVFRQRRAAASRASRRGYETVRHRGLLFRDRRC
jgi:hypothetical protein